MKCPRCGSVEIEQVSKSCSCGQPKHKCKKCGFQSLERFFGVG